MITFGSTPPKDVESAYFLAQTQRFTILGRRDKWASLGDIYEQVTTNVEKEDGFWHGLKQKGGTVWSLIRDCWDDAFGNASKFKEKVFLGGHTFNQQPKQPGDDIKEEVKRIKKMSGFEKFLLLGFESLVLYAKALGYQAQKRLNDFVGGFQKPGDSAVPAIS